MIKDIQLIETYDGGDHVLQGEDIKLIDDMGNQAYLAWFGGNVDQSDWWGNQFIENETSKFRSTTELTLLHENLTSRGRVNIENSANRDLDYLREFARVSVEVSIVDLDHVSITADIEIENYQKYKSKWSNISASPIVFRELLLDNSVVLLDNGVELVDN